MSTIHRLILKALPTRTRLAWSRSRIERGFGKGISAARTAKDYQRLKALEQDRRFELDMQAEEEDAYLTTSLLRKARTLRVPVPHIYNEGGTESPYWYEGHYTGGMLLTDAGIKTLREEIRMESKARNEVRAQLVVWISALTGLIGATTGLIALLSHTNK